MHSYTSSVNVQMFVFFFGQPLQIRLIFVSCDLHQLELLEFKHFVGTLFKW